MQAASDPPAAVSVAGRPWYRLHRSTWVVVLLVLAVLVLVAVPGEFRGQLAAPALAMADTATIPIPTSGTNFVVGETSDTEWEIFEHGWPWTFLERDVDLGGTNWAPRRPLAQQAEDYQVNVEAGWHTAGAWTFHGDGLFFSGWALASNLGVVLLILAAAACLSEWRRRRRGRFFQYTLAEMMLAITLTACVLSWWCVHRYQRREETALAKQLQRIEGFPLRTPTAARYSCESSLARPRWMISAS